MTTNIRADASGAYSALQHNGVDSFKFTDKGILGTVAADDASAGVTGEYVVGQRLAASPLSLTTGVPAAIASISLTAGDWDVQGQVAITAAATTTVTTASAYIDTTVSALNFDRVGATVGVYNNATIAGGSPLFQTGVTRLSLAATTTVYLIARGAFGVSTMTAFGAIHARRVR